MGQISKELPLNPDILRQCREQIGLSIDGVKSEVRSIEQIENGEKLPTYKQLDKLAELYEVPRWVFIRETLPEEYHYEQTPGFRRLHDTQAFQEPEQGHKVRKLIARVERYRDLLIELRDDLDDPIIPFIAPDFNVNRMQPQEAAVAVRQWLDLKQPEEFSDLKRRLEQKSIFIFLTSKYKGWSHMDKKTFRGLCLPHDRLPIIIVNDSDAKKAQSFTLMHELGHLLKGNISIDSWQENDSEEETWCDQFAGNVLMPENQFRDSVASTPEDIQDIKNIAKEFEVSPYACLVRLRQIGKITQPQYEQFEQTLKAEYQSYQDKLRNNPVPIPRNRSKEVKTQFGDLFVNTVLTAWHSEELSLHKVGQLLGLKFITGWYQDYLTINKYGMWQGK